MATNHNDPITPHAMRVIRRHVKAFRSDARASVRELRRMLASDRFIDQEDARDWLANFRQVGIWPHYRAWMRKMTTAIVVKNCHLSPNARARHDARFGCAGGAA